MTNTQPATPPAATAQATAATTTQPQQEWKGLTIDELKMRRAKALVMLKPWLVLRRPTMLCSGSEH